MCAYCGLENEDFKDFVFAFCQSGLDPTVLCSDYKESLKDVLEEPDNTIETQVSWATGEVLTLKETLTFVFQSSKASLKIRIQIKFKMKSLKS